jgi:hypothetical protein
MRALVRIDRRHSPVSAQWNSNDTTVTTFQLHKDATVQDLKDAITASGQCQLLRTFDIVAMPQSVILTGGKVSSYSKHTQCVHCLVTPSTVLPAFGFECMQCAPINIVLPGKDRNEVPLDTSVFRAKIHDDGLANSLAQLPNSEICGLLEVHDANNNVLNADVYVRGSYIICTLTQQLDPGSNYSVILQGNRFRTIKLPPCCSKHTPEEHDLDNQYLPFTTQSKLMHCRRW